MVGTTMDGLAWVRKQVEQADTDLLREMVKLFCKRVMSEEADDDLRRPEGVRNPDHLHSATESPLMASERAAARNR